MGLLLKQSTAATLKIGPFQDDADGSAENGLTIEDSDVRLTKNGGDFGDKHQTDDCVFDEAGYYNCAVDTTDTDTLGRLQLAVWMAGCLPVYHEFMVVTAHVYDSQCGSDYQQVDVIQVGSTTQSATDLKDFADTGYNPVTHKVAGVVLADTCTTCTTTTTNTDLTAFAADYTAARAGYLDELAAANLPTDIANVKAETATIVTDTNELQTDWHDGGRLDLLIDDVLADTNELELDWKNGGRLDLIIDSLALEATVAALNDIDADAVWDEVMDANAPANADTARKIINVIAGVLAAKSSGGGTNTIVFRDTGDTKDRISATVDADGNRTAVGTCDGT